MVERSYIAVDHPEQPRPQLVKGDGAGHLQELGGGLVEVGAGVPGVPAGSAEQPPLHQLRDGLGGVHTAELVDAPPGRLAVEHQ